MNPKYIVTILLLLMCSGTASAAWANTSYTNAKNITLLGADTQLTNYPYLVSIAKESAMQSDYDDLIFYDQPVWSSGNLIEFEIETYNATVATIWLNITTLPTAGKTVSVYYGNAAAVSTQNSEAVWNSDYVGVWHMSDETGGYAWNDYKDPDGVITANASQHYILAEQSVYYEDSKFKAWMRERYAPGMDYFGYWESTNGYDWNEIKTDLLGANGTSAERCRHPFTMPDPNSTGYWLYNFNESTHQEDLYYGTNETNWSIDTYGIFPASAVGGASLVGNVFVWRENTSDWYAIVENSGPTWSSDYATSNDGKSWTFHGQVTVSGFGSDGLSGPWIHKNNGTYYMVFHGNKGNTGGIPSDTYVATCTDRQSWVLQPDFKILRDQDWEGVGLSGGQLADPDLVEYNGEVYIYYQGAHDQSPGATWPHRIGLVHLNESLQELCDHIDAGIPTPTAADSTSNGQDGTLTDIDTSTNGAIGSCMAFDGDSSYIDLGTPTAMVNSTHTFWGNTTSIDAMTNQIYTHNLASENAPFVLTRFTEDGGVDKIKVCAGNSWFDSVDADPNKYYHVAIVANSSGIDVLYINGHEIDTNPHGTGYADDTTSWVFGATRSMAGWYIGTIDEGRVSDVVRSADWINLSYQMVVGDSYVTFGAEETYGASTNDITLAANTYGFLRKDVTAAQAFSTIASGFVHKVCFSWLDNSGECWESYWSGDSYNSALSIPKNDAYFVLMDGTGETVSCGVRAAGNVAIPTGWYATYLGESTAKTLTQIKTDMQVDGDVTNLYTWDHNAGGTGAWVSVDVTPSHSVLPNQGILINNMGAPYNWDGTVN